MFTSLLLRLLGISHKLQQVRFLLVSQSVGGCAGFMTLLLLLLLLVRSSILVAPCGRSAPLLLLPRLLLLLLVGVAPVELLICRPPAVLLLLLVPLPPAAYARRTQRPLLLLLLLLVMGVVPGFTSVPGGRLPHLLRWAVALVALGGMAPTLLGLGRRGQPRRRLSMPEVPSPSRAEAVLAPLV
jgi:hypothetical protein